MVLRIVPLRSSQIAFEKLAFFDIALPVGLATCLPIYLMEVIGRVMIRLATVVKGTR